MTAGGARIQREVATEPLPGEATSDRSNPRLEIGYRVLNSIPYSNPASSRLVEFIEMLGCSLSPNIDY